MAKILLVNPPGTEQLGFQPPPLGLLYIAACLRDAGHMAVIVDGALYGAQIVEETMEQGWDIVGVTALTPARQSAIAVLRRARDLGAKTVIGGAHASVMPRQLLDSYAFIDLVVTGPGEGAMLAIANEQLPHQRDIVDGHKYPLDIHALPFPAWDLIDWRGYPARGSGVRNGIDLSVEPRLPVIFSRGCVGNCTFCSTWHVWRSYTTRRGVDVSMEVQDLFARGVRHLAFQDDMMTGDRWEVVSFCRAIIDSPARVAWMATTRADCVDQELLDLMREAGCYEISYGVESGSERMLRRLHKKEGLEPIRKAFAMTKRAGIKATALMMYGLPDETEEDRVASADLLRELVPDEVGTIGHVLVFPGTALYQQCKRRGLIDDSFWLGSEPYWVYAEEGDRLN